MKINDLYDILLSERPSSLLRKKESELFSLIPELKKCKNFNQNSEWHIYDVYEHILHVIDNVSPKIEIRLSALFHDIGKPLTYSEDENEVGHFYGHWEESCKIFNEFANKYKIDLNIKNKVHKLIYFHDINISKLDKEGLNKIRENFDEEEIELLFELKKADLLAQNEKFNYLLDEYDIQKKKLLNLKNKKRKEYSNEE